METRFLFPGRIWGCHPQGTELNVTTTGILTQRGIYRIFHTLDVLAKFYYANVLDENKEVRSVLGNLRSGTRCMNGECDDESNCKALVMFGWSLVI